MGGAVGREHISLSSISSLSTGSATSNLDALKGNLSCKLAGLSYESQMMDHLHSTAYQNGPSGNSLGNALEGSAESVASLSADDVASVLGGVNGTNVVVVGTGNGSHEKLVAEAEKAYGSLSGASSSKAVGSVADKSAFIGSDVRIRYDSHNVASVLGGVNGTNVVVVGTGNGSHEKLVAEAEKAYGSLSGASSSKAVGSVADKSAFIGSDVRIRYDSHNTATIALGFEGASWTDPKTCALALMTTLLGSFSKSDGLGKNVAAAMCQEVADHDLASSISTFSLSYSDTGLFGMVATAPDNKLDDLLWYVMPNFVRLAHGVSDEEFARAKATLKTQILASWDGDVATAEQMARQISSFGRVMSLNEMMARVDALTMDDVKAAASDVINDQDHALAAIGGIHELPDYNWIRRHSYMLRY